MASGWLTTCPHCGLLAMPAWRKLALGPAATASCRSCGLAVGVAPLRALASFTPSAVLVLAVSVGWLTQPVAMVAGAVVAVAATSLAYLVAVPLVRRQLTDAQAVRAARLRAAALGQGGEC